MLVGIVGIVILLITLGLSLLITKLATEALIITGLSREAAEFQARSAFTGTGFTTSEAESVVNDPVRRRIVTILMIVRSVGLVTVIISLLLSFVEEGNPNSRLIRLLFLLAGLIVLYLLARSHYISGLLKRVMAWAMKRWSHLEVLDYPDLLRVSGDYRVMKIRARQGEWVAGKTLNQCDLAEEGIIVLGIHRSNGNYIGAPRGSTEIEPGDELVLYGRRDAMRELDTRRAGGQGDQAHAEAVSEQKREAAREEQEDRRRQEVEDRRDRQQGQEQKEPPDAVPEQESARSGNETVRSESQE
ncbi:MAG: TrkA C-terminal domain-containing protein [Phycisphaerae bacterium]